MKVKDLISRLQKCDPDAVVALADWNEEYDPPNVEVAERIKQCDGPEGRMVIIGAPLD